MARLVAFLCFTLVMRPGSGLHAQTEKKDSAVFPPEVSIASTQLVGVSSSITKEKYDLYVNLPRDYGDTTKVFPVVYLLDAQWDFTLLQSLFGQQYYDGFVPSIVVVGITWSGVDANYDSLRARDFTPTPTGETPQGGNAANFLQFIKKELIPFVQSKYRVEKGGGTLIGSSLGGLFTLYTMFNEPELFDQYILTSPALTWDNGIIYKYESAFAEKHEELPARLFMGIGSYEDLAPFNKFVDQLRSEQIGGLKLETSVLDGFGHSGGKATGFSKGLQFVFGREPVSLSDSVLEGYAGDYEFPSGRTARISIVKGSLVLHDSNNLDVTLYARSVSDFYKIGSFLFLHFKKNGGGKVTGFVQESFAGDAFARRVNR